MQVFEVEGELMSPKKYEHDAGWIVSHQKRSYQDQAKLNLTARDAQNKDGVRQR